MWPSGHFLRRTISTTYRATPTATNTATKAPIGIRESYSERYRLGHDLPCGGQVGVVKVNDMDGSAERLLQVALELVKRLGQIRAMTLSDVRQRRETILNILARRLAPATCACLVL